MCPGGVGHQGQDIRPATCKDNTWEVMAVVDGIITLILAIMIWRAWPASSVWVIGTLVGISMIFSGVSRLMLSLAAKRVLRTAIT